jgi:uncharacterized membrane protein YoaK (UPF0700 family)
VSFPILRLSMPLETNTIDRSLGLKLLPGVLSVIAGSMDIISFLGLNGLFTAHITGNLILIAAHVVAGSAVSIARLLSVPVFILVLGLTRLLAAGLELVGLAPLRPLLLLQLLFLAGTLVLGVCAVSPITPDTASTVLAGMLAVSAMAVQNAMVQISLQWGPPTAVMTTNITRFVLDVGEVLLGKDPAEVAEARRRAKCTWPAIVGFTAGAGLGAACFAAAGLWSLALPTGLALLTLAMVPKIDVRQRS